MNKTIGGLKRTSIGVYFSKENKIKRIDLAGEVSIDEMIEYLKKLKEKYEGGKKNGCNE